MLSRTILSRTMSARILFVVAMVSVLILGACQPPAAPPAPSQTEKGAGAAPEASSSLVIYSGRNQNLVGPLIERFQEKSGIPVEVRYGGTAELAATILEEGANSPADVFYGQDAGALGALARAGRLATLPQDVLELVEPRFRSREGNWVGTSGRARVFVYNTEELSEDQVPNSIWELTDPKWKGKVGWAPTNGSFQSFVTALRVLEGEEQARAWLEAMIANETQVYPKNTPIVEATGRGEILLGLVNHYYLYRFLAEDPNFPARNHHPSAGDAGAMINVAGVGVLDTAKNRDAAMEFARFLLSTEAQQYFADETNEYPLIPGIKINPLLTPLSEIKTPDLDLSDLDDLQGTLELLQEVGALD